MANEMFWVRNQAKTHRESTEPLMGHRAEHLNSRPGGQSSLSWMTLSYPSVEGCKLRGPIVGSDRLIAVKVDHGTHREM
jgi:hypothetical protein